MCRVFFQAAAKLFASVAIFVGDRRLVLGQVKRSGATSLSQTTNRGGVYRIGSREIGLHLASLEPCDSLLPWDALLTGGSDSSWVFRMGNKSAQSAFPHRR
jgi:hypothetical protein